MTNFFRKNNEEKEPEDFVLFTSEDETTEETNTDSEETFENTNSLDIVKVNEGLAKTDSDIAKTDVKSKLLSLFSRSIWFKVTAAAVAAVIVCLGIFGAVILANPLHGYEQIAADKGNIMNSFEVESTLLPGNRYEITSLVSGKIVESNIEVGDEVELGDVLYKIDDTEAKLVVERAKNELERVKDPGARLTSVSPRIIATDAGVVESLKITSGSTVNAGSHIGTLRKADGTTEAIVSYVSGKINVVSVRVGQSLSVGQLIATIKDDSSTSAETSGYTTKSGEIDLQTAQRQLENYTIKAPVSGTVVEKNSRTGDNVGITDNDKPMMVIVDSSELSFKFSVDEYRIRDIEKGQEVIVTTESISDTTFDGVVTAVSNQGYKNDADETMFDVTVTISKPEDLKSGMNIKATVILSSRKNTLSVPQKALMATDGKNGLVLVKRNGGAADSDTASATLENKLAFPWIKVPKNCDLVTVTYGLSDGSAVEILSGLKSGDIVAYKASEEYDFVPSTVKEEETKADDWFASDFSANFDDSDDLQIDLENELEDMLQKSDNL